MAGVHSSMRKEIRNYKKNGLDMKYKCLLLRLISDCQEQTALMPDESTQLGRVDGSIRCSRVFCHEPISSHQVGFSPRLHHEQNNPIPQSLNRSWLQR